MFSRAVSCVGLRRSNPVNAFVACRDERALFPAPGHVLDGEEKTKAVRDVDEHAGEMIRAGILSEQLDVQHV